MNQAEKLGMTSERYVFLQRAANALPQDFMKTDMHLRNTELKIYSIIYNYAINGESYDDGLKPLAQLLCVAYSSVRRTVTSLINKGYVTKSVGTGKYNEYNVNISALPHIPMFRLVHKLNEES